MQKRLEAKMLNPFPRFTEKLAYYEYDNESVEQRRWDERASKLVFHLGVPHSTLEYKVKRTSSNETQETRAEKFTI